MIEVPPALAQRRISVSGETGRQWIASLPEKVALFCDEWDLTISGPAMQMACGNHRVIYW